MTMNTPPVDQLVLYKHGIAVVGRSGPADGDFELTLRRDDMKDVLKSLTVEVIGGQATVGTVEFDTPAEPQAVLAARHLLLDSGAALVGLLDAVRGRIVEVDLGDAGRRRGEVIGVDGEEARRTLLLRTESGSVTLVDLTQARRVEFVEAPSRDDLDYLIDRSRAATAGPNCAVRVQLRGAADRVRVSYLVPAPMWRVSYRLVRDGKQLTLAAMGIVHNPLDEDLTDIELTLTTGEPISFDIDLYHGRQVRRTVVEERERAEETSFGAAPAPPAGRQATRAVGAAMTGYADAAARVETGDRGEHFEYRLSDPVSLKRGGSAMVPLALAPVDDVRREVVWSGGSGPAPDIMLTFTNSTGIVLEEGPAVIYEQGGYAGEAMLGFTARSAPVRLAFAKDLAVRCGRTSTMETVTARVRLADDAVVEERRNERLHTLRVDNDHDEPVEVIVEIPLASGHHIEPRDGATALEVRDGAVHRFALTAPGHGAALATVLESWPDYTRIDYRQLSPGQLEEWLAGRSLDAGTVAALSGVLGHWEQADRLDDRCAQLTTERDEVFDAQTRISDQLGVLGTEGPEGELRARQVGELQRRIAQVAAIESGIADLRGEAAAARKAAHDTLTALIGG